MTMTASRTPILPVLVLALAALAVGVIPARAGAPGACFTDREVSIESTAGGIRLAGTLSVPAGPGPHPAVLLITGNGPHTRDQMISGSPMFAQIARHLARRGLAVLRTDARGYGGSTGPNDWEQTTTADRVADNRAALGFLRRQPGIDPGRVVLLGHSEGAMIAAALAASGEAPALTVLLSTSARPGDEVFARQRADNLRRRGASEEAAQAVYEQLLRFADFLAHDREDLPRFKALAIDFLAAHGVPRDEVDPAQAEGLLEGFLKAPWYIHFVGFDPRTDLRRITTPVWAVWGGADEDVPWRRHLPSMATAFAEGGLADYSLVVLPDEDHFFLEFEGRRREKHEPGRMEIADELVAALDAELARRGLLREACPAPPPAATAHSR